MPAPESRWRCKEVARGTQPRPSERRALQCSQKGRPTTNSRSKSPEPPHFETTSSPSVSTQSPLCPEGTGNSPTSSGSERIWLNHPAKTQLTLSERSPLHKLQKDLTVLARRVSLLWHVFNELPIVIIPTVKYPRSEKLNFSSSWHSWKTGASSSSQWKALAFERDYLKWGGTKRLPVPIPLPQIACASHWLLCSKENTKADKLRHPRPYSILVKPQEVMQVLTSSWTLSVNTMAPADSTANTTANTFDCRSSEQNKQITLLSTDVPKRRLIIRHHDRINSIIPKPEQTYLGQQ